MSHTVDYVRYNDQSKKRYGLLLYDDRDGV